MNCHLLGHLYSINKESGEYECRYCNEVYKPAPLTTAQQVAIMAVFCGVFTLIGFHADEIAIWIWEMMA